MHYTLKMANSIIATFDSGVKATAWEALILLYLYDIGVEIR